MWNLLQDVIKETGCADIHEVAHILGVPIPIDDCEKEQQSTVPNDSDQHASYQKNGHDLSDVDPDVTG